VNAALAFDLGGTRIKAGFVEPRSRNGPNIQTADTGSDFSEALDYLKTLGQEVAAGRDFSGVGLCVPGLVDERGIIRSLPGKLDGIVGFDLPGFLNREFGRPSVVVNDALAYGVGEAIEGAGTGSRRVVVVTIGTGVGVTVVEEGRPLGVGELGGGILGGQIPISEANEGYADTSGRPDTIEALCLAQRIVDYANEVGGHFRSVEEVYHGFEKRDPAALSGIERYRAHLVRAMVALAHAHAPDVIVIGGGPLTEANALIPGLADQVNPRLFGNFEIEIKRATLGDAAALFGLARMLEDR
jgi:glucokinase